MQSSLGQHVFRSFRHHSVVDEELFTRHSSPVTLFHIRLSYLLENSLDRTPELLRQVLICLANCHEFSVIFPLDCCDSLFSRSLINRKMSSAASALGVVLFDHVEVSDTSNLCFFFGVLNRFKAYVFLFKGGLDVITKFAFS